MIYHDVTIEQPIRIIVDAVKQESNQELLVPTGISIRHIHLERKYINQLFGYGHRLQVKRVLNRPGQYACEGTLDVIGPKGIPKGIRVLGPEWNQSQVEVAFTDARALGVTPPVRASGNLTGTPSTLPRGPEGEVVPEQGIIMAGRHIHMSPEDAAHFHAKDRELAQVEISGKRPGIMGHVRIRVSSGCALNFHTDTDNGDAFPLKQGQSVKALTVQEKGQNTILGVVKKTMVSTRKVDNLVGCKFLLVKPYFGDQSEIIVAGDTVGASIGELMLMMTDETTQHALTREAPMDAFTVGVVDSPPVIGRWQTRRQWI